MTNYMREREKVREERIPKQISVLLLGQSDTHRGEKLRGRESLQPESLTYFYTVT